MRGILVNPWLKEVKEVEVQEGIEDIYRHLSSGGVKVRVFALSSYWPNMDTMYVDDEGFFNDGSPVMIVQGTPLIGMGLILGGDNAGNSVDAKSSLVDIQNSVVWTNHTTGKDHG